MRAYLAKHGKRVLVVEARAEAGGAATTRAFTDEFSVSAVAHLANSFDEKIFRDFRLRRHGLSLSARVMPTVALAEDGSHIVLTGDPEQDGASIGRHWPADALAYETFMRALRRIGDALGPLFRAPVHAPEDKDRKTRRTVNAVERALKRLTREERDLSEALLSGAIGDVLDRRFETPRLKGALGFLACLGHAAGPYTEGTGLSFLLRTTLERSGARARHASSRGPRRFFARAVRRGLRPGRESCARALR